MNSRDGNQDLRATFLEDIKAQVDHSGYMGIIHNMTDATLSAFSVFSSVAATVLVGAIGKTHPLIVAVVAAIPAACTSLQRIVDFRRRSFWYFDYEAKLTALALKVEFKDTEIEPFAEERAQIEIEGNRLWQQIPGAHEIPGKHTDLPG